MKKEDIDLQACLLLQVSTPLTCSCIEEKCMNGAPVDIHKFLHYVMDNANGLLLDVDL